MLNKQDFINKSTSLYDTDAISGLATERPSGGVNQTPAEHLMQEEDLGPELKVAGAFGSGMRALAGAMGPKRFKADRSVADIRKNQFEMGAQLEEGDIRNVLAPEGPFSGTKQGNLSGMTSERNINLDNINTPDDIKSVIDDMAQFQGGNMEARRGEISHAQTRMMAQQSVDAIELITGWKPSTTWNAEQITSARQLMVNVSQNIQIRAKQLTENPETTSSADWANFAKMQKTFAGIQQTVTGATAEAGRTLSALKIPIEGDQRMAAMAQAMENSGGEELLRKQAQLIAEMDKMDPDMLASKITKTLEAKNQGVLAEIWVNGRLSSPVTHAVNIVSNTFMQGFESYMVKPTAASIGAIRRAAGGTDEAISWDEVSAESYGMMSSFGEAIELFGKRIAGKGETDLFMTPNKHEMEGWNAFSSQNLFKGKTQGTSFGRVIDFIGDYYVRLPGRFLESEDLFFKTITYRKELNAQAVRMAKQEGLGGDAYDARVRDLINNPTHEMDSSASSRSEYETFTGDPSQYDSLFGNLAKSMAQLSARHSSLKFIAPFIRTPTNILRYSAENSILAPVTKKWQSDFKAGGVKRDMALARLSIGTTAFASITQMYDLGYITGGGPTDPSARKGMEKLGWQRNSIKINDKYYAFDKMDPMGFTMAMIAGSMDRTKYSKSEEEGSIEALQVVLALGDSFTDKTFMTGFAELFQLVGQVSRGEGEKGTVKFGTGIAAAFVPAWLTLIAKAEDTDEQGRSIVRDPRRFSKSYQGIWSNLQKSIQSRMPSGKPYLPAQRNWKGEVVTHSGGGYADELFFIKRSEAKSDPATRALLENWVAPRVPRQIQSIPVPMELAQKYGVVEVELDLMELDENQGHAFEEFQAYVGKARNSFVADFTSSAKYKEIPDEHKGNESFTSSVLESLLESGMKAGKAQFFSEYNAMAEEKGWNKFTDDDIIKLIERKLSEKGKEFPSPDAPTGGEPEF